ncbi:MAG: hypothetical protein JST89_24005 [Cyanobacteria bacterium SZAS-4]|nr:hypothetical protein [Cyanobacteria bacterium SZAS-4]
MTLLLASQAVNAQATLQIPKLGSAERTALLDCLRADKSTQGLNQLWKVKKVVFFDVTNRVKGGWAYVSAKPGTLDGKHKQDPVNVVLQQNGGKWKLIESVSDEVGPAENPDAAFKEWYTKFIASHKSCPVEIFPAHF